ncbi:ribonuclease III domain-containing protein [Xylariaceae sp. FL0804]|nr:ribonuclease III domain-containing protein [Xylariaceae sp. FL0804]
MSKRKLTDVSEGDRTDVVRIMEQVDELMRAAQALKQDLEAVRGSSETDALATVRRHSRQILPITHSLFQDKPTSSASQDLNGFIKSRKLDHAAEGAQAESAALRVPSVASLTQWTLKDISSSSLPPLPPVLDPVLEKAALTHSGMITKSGEGNYERLEWLGDAYLELIASAFIYQTFPNLAAGRCSQLRERIIKNETLSEFIIKYGIHKRTNFPAEFDMSGREGGTSASQKSRKKILGDIFESYVGAVILGDDTGLSRVADWLKAIWSSTLKEDIRRELQSNEASGKSTGVPSSTEVAPKVRLSQTVGTKGVRITYEDMREPKKDKNTGLPLFIVGAYYDGLDERHILLGYGSALSKKEAGAKAALAALENKKLMKRLQQKKLDLEAVQPAIKTESE